MRRISKDNYEVWFIDFLDGKLDEQARRELDEFLQFNPELKKELNAFEELKLEPSTIRFDAPEKLQKGESDLIEISRPDYLLVKQMEEGLSEEEEKELAVKIRKDESLIKRGVEFQHTRLAIESIRYEGKSSLLQKRIKPVWLSAWRVGAVGIVAGLLLFFGDAPRFLLSTGANEIVMERLEPLPFVISDPDIPELKLAEVQSFDLSSHSSSIYSVDNRIYAKVKDEDGAEDSSSMQRPMVKLSSNGIKMDLAGGIPNAYEAGLRQMMPLYLDINRKDGRLLTAADTPDGSQQSANILTRGLQFVDRVSGDLVQFDKLYDEDGNFVAYNLKAGNFEMERKLKR
ncbi:hypothetical protein [Marinilabilia sp.]|uniref:hypothetical protein n=1 Tax=Marinilabilia sp. TaxID=2021252 RepID=UPI0025BDDB05|nr:hypothetical protein [Marinilabilia sp.]